MNPETPKSNSPNDIGNLLLRTLPARGRETGEDGPAQVIFDMPRPVRDEHPTRCASPACPGPLWDSDRGDPPETK
jgi:hypothetical protein